MGFLDFLFGKKNDVEASITVSFSEESEANKLAKEATQLKKEKKYEEALGKFLKALDTQGSKDFSIQMKLRLPMYYQLLGRGDDAWREYQNLSLDYIGPYEQGPIQDKMRLHLQREKRYKTAIPHGIFSFIMGIQGLQSLGEQTLKTIGEFKRLEIETETLVKSLKQDMDRVSNAYTKDAITNMLIPLLKKAKMEDIEQPLCTGVIAICDKIHFDGHRALYIEVHNLCQQIFLKHGYLER